MVRVPYKILAPHVDRLYEKEFPYGDDQAIEGHIAEIVAFLHTCGWTEEEYLREFIAEMDPEREDDLTSNIGALHSQNNQAS